MSRALFLARIFTLATLPASASVHHWFGTANNRLSDPANWAGGAPVDDPEAELVFDSATVRHDLYNDIPNLRFRSMSFDYAPYTLFGEPLRANDSSITRGRLAIYCDISIDRTLQLSGSVEVHGAISGTGAVIIDGGTATFSGPRPNTYA